MQEDYLMGCIRSVVGGVRELLVTKLELGLPAARLPRAWQVGNGKLSPKRGITMG